MTWKYRVVAVVAPGRRDPLRRLRRLRWRPSDDGGAPGVPGSPIDYDSTLALASPAAAKESILDEVGRLCDGGCGIEVVIRGSGECSPEIGPDPVARGGTITIVAGPCPGPPTEPSTSDEPSAAGTSTTTTG